MKKVLVIAGPTASGKTAFSIKAAKMLGWEIISGDSIQVYRGEDIGSGKVTDEEKEGIPHHLIDIMDPDEPYSAADFQKMARKLIDTAKEGIIICGGTGLYLKSCLYDYEFAAESGSSIDEDFEAMDNAQLFALLQKTDPVQAQKIHPNNRRRLQRSLTIAKRTGMAQSEIEAQQTHEPVYDIFIAGCTMDREKLYDRINRRVEMMFAAGLQKEIEELLEKGYTFNDPGLQGIGYKEWKAFFAGTANAQEVMADIQKHSRQFAKRQYTWLNHQMPVQWFISGDPSEEEQMLEKIRRWSTNA